MEKITGNEPAFPIKSKRYNQQTGDTETAYSPGLTKREYFAVMIMATKSKTYGDNSASQKEAAKLSVIAADALIEQLNKNQ